MTVDEGDKAQSDRNAKDFHFRFAQSRGGEKIDERLV
jgi:hypothetical protein